MFDGFTDKQLDVLKQPYAKLVILNGAVRSGKTYLTYFITPDIISLHKNSNGFIGGKTLATITENIIRPMQDLYGHSVVSDIKTDSGGVKYSVIFGKRVRCVGATDKKAVDKIRGATYGWAICDEVATWDEGTFDMLMSRLSEPNSVCVCTCNPDEPTHWFNRKYILKDGIDKRIYNFTIDDNPLLDKAYVENLKNMYRGSVLYDRLILGLWASGSGAIYKRFIEEPDKYIMDDTPENIQWLRENIIDYAVGIDFGENVSATKFTLVGLLRGYNGIVALEEKHIVDHKDTALLQKQYVDFVKECLNNGWRVNRTYYDSAQKTLGESIKSASIMNGFQTIVDKCVKDPINERVNQEISLFGVYRLKILKRCKWLIKAFKEAVYDDKSDNRLDVVSSENPVDDLDSFEYAYQRWASNLMKVAQYTRLEG